MAASSLAGSGAFLLGAGFFSAAGLAAALPLAAGLAAALPFAAPLGAALGAAFAGSSPSSPFAASAFRACSARVSRVNQ